MEADIRVLNLLERIAQALERQADAVEKSVAARVSRAAPGELSDAELDGNPRNDPAVRKDPKSWKGPPCSGRTLSQCPPEYLDVYSNAKEYQAEKERDEAGTIEEPEAKKKKLQYAGYSLLDAKRARAWARRIRSGWKAPEKPPPADWKSPSNGTATGPSESWKTPAPSEPKPNSPEDVGFAPPRDDERRDEWDDE